MKYFTGFALILLFSYEAMAKQAVPIATDIFKVYKLHGVDTAPLPMSVLYIYDAKAQKMMTQEQVLSIFSRDSTITATTIEGIKVFSKETSTKKINQADIKQASKFINIDTRYIAFYHNVGADMLGEFPVLVDADKAIFKHLSAQEDVNLYTVF